MTPGDRPPIQPSGALVIVTLATVVALIGTFLPWLWSGSTSRSSYDLVGVRSQLDLAADGLVSVLVRWWPIVPLLMTLAIVTAWWRWTSVAVVAAVVSAVYAGGVGAAVIVSARGTSFGVGPGPWVCLGGSVALLLSAAWLPFTNATHHDAPAPREGPPADRS